MLDALRKPLTRVEPTSVKRRQATQAEKDADAIMAGIRRARSSTPTERVKIAPTVPDDKLLNP
jgi:riboflavin biosynthesis pyrimidine reductase